MEIDDHEKLQNIQKSEQLKKEFIIRHIRNKLIKPREIELGDEQYFIPRGNIWEAPTTRVKKGSRHEEREMLRLLKQYGAQEGTTNQRNLLKKLKLL